jgi:hypothetical protein
MNGGLSGILCPCAVSQYEDEILGRSLGFGAALDTGDKEYKVGNSRYCIPSYIEGECLIEDNAKISASEQKKIEL